MFDPAYASHLSDSLSMVLDISIILSYFMASWAASSDTDAYTAHVPRSPWCKRNPASCTLDSAWLCPPSSRSVIQLGEHDQIRPQEAAAASQMLEPAVTDNWGPRHGANASFSSVLWFRHVYASERSQVKKISFFPAFLAEKHSTNYEELSSNVTSHKPANLVHICMYVSIYVYAYIYIHIYIHTYTYICIYVYIYIYLHKRIHVYIQTNIYIYIYI